MKDKTKKILKIIFWIIAVPVIFVLSSMKNKIFEYAHLPFEESIPLILKESLELTVILCVIFLVVQLVRWITYLIKNRNDSR